MKRSKSVTLATMGVAALALAGCKKEEADCRRFTDTQQFNECREGIRHVGGTVPVYHHSYFPLPYAIGAPSSPVRTGTTPVITGRPSTNPSIAASPPPRVGPPPATAPTAVARGGFGGSAVAASSSS